MTSGLSRTMAIVGLAESDELGEARTCEALAENSHRDPQVGAAQPQGPDARAHDLRGLPQLSVDILAPAPAGLLSRD